jgi:excisionase family DNA binding protein
MLEQGITIETCLLKTNDVARLLNISRAFAYQLMRQGEIPTVKIGNAVRVPKKVTRSPAPSVSPTAPPRCGW